MFPCESSFQWINCSTWTWASIFFGQNSVLSLQNNRSRGLSMICFISFDPAADTSQATPYNVVLWVEKFIQRLAPSCYLIWPLKTFNLEYQIPKPRNKGLREIFLKQNVFSQSASLKPRKIRKVKQIRSFCRPVLVRKKQGNYSLRRPPKLIIPQAVIRHWEKMSFCMHIDV